MENVANRALGVLDELRKLAEETGLTVSVGAFPTGGDLISISDYEIARAAGSTEYRHTTYYVDRRPDGVEMINIGTTVLHIGEKGEENGN